MAWDRTMFFSFIFSLSVRLSIIQSVRLFCLSAYLSVCQYDCLNFSSLCLCARPFVNLSVCLSALQSVCMSVFESVFLSFKIFIYYVCLCVCLNVCLSKWLPVSLLVTFVRPLRLAPTLHPVIIFAHL